MKISILIFLCISTSAMWGQKVYTSSATQHFPSAKMESLDRVITFDKEKITIKTVTKDDKVKIQTLKIVDRITNYDNHSTVLVFKCSSRNRRTPTTVMIEEKRPTFITLLEPSLKDPDKMLEYKLILDL